jgi:hypothetical protein
MCFFTLKCCTGIIQYMLYRYSMYCMVRYSTYLYSPILETGERSESSRHDGCLKAKFCSYNSSKVCHAPVGAMTRPWPIHIEQVFAGAWDKLCPTSSKRSHPTQAIEGDSRGEANVEAAHQGEKTMIILDGCRGWLRQTVSDGREHFSSDIVFVPPL